jgi:Flp pilus assembly protein TadB
MSISIGALTMLCVAALLHRLTRPAPRRPGQSPSNASSRPGPSDNDAVAAFEWAAGEIRSGTHPAAAVRRALERHPGVLAETRQSLDNGVSLSASVARESAGSDDERWFAHNLRLCDASSGSTADVLERAAAIARERRAWAAERRAVAAQARLSARLLTLVPIGFAAWGVVASPSVRAAYRATPLVLGCTLAGCLLNLIGWWWMRHLVTGLPTGGAGTGFSATAQAGRMGRA